jgi:hypothetical protein
MDLRDSSCPVQFLTRGPRQGISNAAVFLRDPRVRPSGSANHEHTNGHTLLMWRQLTIWSVCRTARPWPPVPLGRRTWKRLTRALSPGAGAGVGA